MFEPVYVFQDIIECMKSIYSLPILQGILDHFGVGKITYVTYFDYIGRKVWRHFIETDKGEFELYSFPTELHEYALDRIEKSPVGNRGILNPNACHSFDRYHLLKQLAKKVLITKNQLSLDFQALEGQAITKIFRVYGTILQSRFSNNSVFCSYAKWSLKDEEGKTLIESSSNSKKEIDSIIDSLAEKQLSFQSFAVERDTLHLAFSKGFTFSFHSEGHFAAVEIRFSGKAKDLRFYGEKKICYLKEF